jgi:hypothetical protein
MYLQLHDLPKADRRWQTSVKEVDRGDEGAALVKSEEVKMCWHPFPVSSFVQIFGQI